MDKQKMLIVDDSQLARTILKDIFDDACDGWISVFKENQSRSFTYVYSGSCCFWIQ